LRDLFEEWLDIELSILEAALQYDNAFRYTGRKEEYDSSGLLDETGHYVPQSILDRGASWHLHQGWFRMGNEVLRGRILERMHRNALEENGCSMVKFTSLLRYDCPGNGLPAAGAFGESDSRLPELFKRLHQLSKEGIGNYLTNEMSERIQLYGL